MKNETKTLDCCGGKGCKHDSHHHSHGGSNPIYGLGVIGALFYFLQNTTSFVAVLMGIGKAFFWPAILMFKLLTYLKM